MRKPITDHRSPITDNPHPAWTSPLAILLGVAAALLVGFSKTGMPGAGIPAVALMAEVFRENTKLSVGAILPLLILGDLFAIAYYRRHADWKRLLSLCPYVVAGMVPAYLVLRFVDDDVLRVSIGVLILVLLLLHVVRQRYGFQQTVRPLVVHGDHRRAGWLRHDGQQRGGTGDGHLPGQPAHGQASVPGHLRLVFLPGQRQQDPGIRRVGYDDTQKHFL